MKSKVWWFKRAGWFVYGLWHLLFVIVALAILLPYVTLPIINSVRLGAAPLHYALYVSFLVAIPFLSMLIVWFRFRENVYAALKLFYAVELPLMLLLLLRVVLFREAPLAAQLIFVHIAIGIAAYFGVLWCRKKPTTLLGNYFDLVLSTLVALVGVYCGLLLGLPFLSLFFSFIAEIWKGLMSFQWSDFLDFLQHISFDPLVIMFVMLFFITAFFFLTTPVLLVLAYLQQFIVRYRLNPLPRLLTVVFAVLVVESVIVGLSISHPQVAAFEWTETLPIANKEQGELLAREQEIREGLLNGYLASYRYLSTTGSSRSVQKSYSKILWDGSKVPEYAQNFFNTLALPFLYKGQSFEGDKTLAAQRYQEFFDTPIEKGERDSILKAVKATWENEQNEAGLMNAASHYVLLKSQSIEIKEHGDIATITISQVLENQTFQAHEVVFHFSLPEDAVITGLWMSDDLTNPEKFAHVVSPRGAAQSVYKSEVQRRIDPALLEKVGPLQYRLRAFPIPPRVSEGRQDRNRYRDAFKNFVVTPAVVQFQYVVSIDGEGGWPMPELLEKRNVYWNETTIRSHKSQRELAWLPESIKATSLNSAKAHSIAISGRIIEAIPRDEQAVNSTFERPIAVMIDGSYSMNRVKNRLEEEVDWLGREGTAYDLFFCQTTCSEIKKSDVRNLVYFGNSQLSEQLAQLGSFVEKDYSSLFVLSDEGSYELSGQTEEDFDVPQQPLWLVHLSEQLPYAYDDKVIDAVNDSGGGIAQTLTSAIEQYFWNQKLGRPMEASTLIGASERYFWYLLDGDTPITEQETTEFAALAADRLIQYIAATSDKTQLEILDQIHALAKQADIVSFYSSMLVLVEDRQRELLKEAEAADDRFDREIETGEETLGKPADPFSVPGVPEPEEWALLLVAGCLLLISYRRRFGPQCFRSDALKKVGMCFSKN